MTRRKILILAWGVFIALAGFSVLGAWWRGRPLSPSISDPMAYPAQVAVGALLGFGCSASGLWLVFRLRWFAEYRRIVKSVYRELQPTWLDLAFVSFGAGISEELFFRGLLLPWIGLFGSAILFWLAHGAVSLKSPGINLYGLSIFIAGLGLGELYLHMGLVAAIAAHTAIDLTSLWGFKLLLRDEMDRSVQSPGASMNP